MERVFSFSSGGRGVSILTCRRQQWRRITLKGWGVSVEQSPGQSRWDADHKASFEIEEGDHSPLSVGKRGEEGMGREGKLEFKFDCFKCL